MNKPAEAKPVSFYGDIVKAYPKIGELERYATASIVKIKIVSLEQRGYEKEAQELLKDLRGGMPLRWLRKKWNLPIPMKTAMDSEGR